MSDTIRQKIVDEIKRRLAAISVANGYQTELGAGTIDEWPVSYQQDECPALGVFDLVTAALKSAADEKRIPNSLPVQVRIFLKRETTPATVRVMIADVMRAVARDPTSQKVDYTLGQVAVDMLPDEEGFVVPPDSFQIDGAAVGFVVQYLSEPFNAYQ